MLSSATLLERRLATLNDPEIDPQKRGPAGPLDNICRRPHSTCPSRSRTTRLRSVSSRIALCSVTPNSRALRHRLLMRRGMPLVWSWTAARKPKDRLLATGDAQLVADVLQGEQDLTVEGGDGEVWVGEVDDLPAARYAAGGRHSRWRRGRGPVCQQAGPRHRTGKVCDDGHPWGLEERDSIVAGAGNVSIERDRAQAGRW